MSQAAKKPVFSTKILYIGHLFNFRLMGCDANDFISLFMLFWLHCTSRNNATAHLQSAEATAPFIDHGNSHYFDQFGEVLLYQREHSHMGGYYQLNSRS